MRASCSSPSRALGSASPTAARSPSTTAGARRRSDSGRQRSQRLHGRLRLGRRSVRVRRGRRLHPPQGPRGPDRVDGQFLRPIFGERLGGQRERPIDVLGGAVKKTHVRFLTLAWLALLASGTARGQFGKFVALGDSLAAGEESNCIVERFQQRSWVKLVANQLGQSDFQQPLFAEVPATDPLTGYPCLGPVLVGTSISVGIVSEQ